MKHMTDTEMREHYRSHGSDLADASRETIQKIQSRRNNKGYAKFSDLEAKRVALNIPKA